MNGDSAFNEPTTKVASLNVLIGKKDQILVNFMGGGGGSHYNVICDTTAQMFVFCDCAEGRDNPII